MRHEPDDLIRRFEDGSLPASDFHHRDHVRLAWLYLKEEPVLGALTRFTEGLKRFAARNGHAGLYHETITWAYFFLIHERVAQAEADEGWEAFAERNPDLLTWKPSVLDGYYRVEALGSALAKRVFVLPDQSGPSPERLTCDAERSSRDAESPSRDGEGSSRDDLATSRDAETSSRDAESLSRDGEAQLAMKSRRVAMPRAQVATPRV